MSEEKNENVKTNEKAQEKVEVKDSEKTKETKVENKGNKKTAIIITLVTIIVVALAAVGGYFAYQYMEEKKPIEQEWANTYYNYIKEQKNEAITGTKIQNNSKIGFTNVEGVENPVMFVEYNKEEKPCTDIYYINNGTVKNIIDLGISDVELLYNINSKEYSWYTHKETETTDTYEKVSDLITSKENTNSTEDNTTENTTGKTFTKGEEVSTDTISGDTISIPKFDTEFVETDVDIGKIDYSQDMTDKELKNSITDETNNLKNKDEMLTEEVKNNVTQKVEEVENKQQEMEKAKEEKAKKEEEMKITSANVQEKISEHLKMASMVYLGEVYGVESVYKTNDVTGTVNIPGIDSNVYMTMEVVGLKSIQSLKDRVSACITSSAINKLQSGMKGDYAKYLKEYNGKVYIVRGGIGDGPMIDTKKAKVLSSEGGTSKVQLTDIDGLTGETEAILTLTVEYNNDTQKHMVTDCTVKKLY